MKRYINRWLALAVMLLAGTRMVMAVNLPVDEVEQSMSVRDAFGGQQRDAFRYDVAVAMLFVGFLRLCVRHFKGIINTGLALVFLYRVNKLDDYVAYVANECCLAKERYYKGDVCCDNKDE